MSTGRDPVAATSAIAPTARSAEVSLESLAPHYVKSQHKTYLRRLNEAVGDPRNRNIALTGRYGTGKSSILDQFQDTHENTTLRLAISTLGPPGDGDSTTNRIQKELVKQLIYSASPQTLRGSTFSRRTPPSLGRAVAEAATGVGLLGLLLALLGWLPDLAGAGDGQPGIQRVALWMVFVVLAVTIVTGLRLMMSGRVISDVSAVGAAVSLTERPLTYFDKYLDEIVNYFDAQSPDFVILEDLDRFGDPHIFEALRELNTLLNSTPKRVEKDKPLRFIYAVRDSLFEKLGADTNAEGDDAAAAETIRANRTKFFDIVIPVVPFISHRNARDLLRGLLTDAKITNVDRPLVDLIAQYATDMRLLVNMRNEYLVFAERLLESDKPAPGLTPTGLFALVAYKNFHLEDFENISRRGSRLDSLYRYRRILVRTSVSISEAAKRDILKGRGRAHAKSGLAAELGARLCAVSEAAMQQYGSHGYYPRFIVAEQGFKSEQVSTPTFWAAVAEAGRIDVQATRNPDSNGSILLSLHRAQIDGLFPETFDADRWEEIDEDEVRARLDQHDRDVTFLQGADFGTLASADRFKLTDDGSPTDDIDKKYIGLPFGTIVDETMNSDLACELVKRGYIDRNYALYAAQFYGDFAGVDVATFVVQSVQTNTMDIDYRFTTPGAVGNLISEVGEEFTRTVSAYNIAVVDYLLENRSDLAENVVSRVVSNFDTQAGEFLSAYFSTGKLSPSLATRLSARGWRDIFTHLVTSDEVSSDIRVPLVDAALQGAVATQNYDLGGAVAEFVGEHYQEMSTFKDVQADDRIRAVTSLVERANVRISDLAKVQDGLRSHLVENGLYQLTAPNLRAALVTPGSVSMDHVRESDAVYAYCLNNPARYLAAVEGDEYTQHTIEAADTLRTVLLDVADTWTADHVAKLIARAAPSSALETVAEVPVSTWPALAGARLFRASLVNLEAYLAEVGAIDEHLAHLLLSAGSIQVDADGVDDDAASVDKVAAAAAIVNSNGTIPTPRDRVELVATLGLDGPLPVTQLQLEGGELLALLINAGVVADDVAAFRHFHAAGWSALEPAIVASEHFTDWVEPGLLDGMVAQVFGSAAVRDKIGRIVVNRLDEFVADSDPEALIAAARFAIEQDIGLPAEQVRRIAASSPRARDVTVRLLQMAPPSPAEIVSALIELGEPYSNLSTRHHSEFQVPYDEAHKAVFGRLASAGLCETSKKRMQDLLNVKLM